MIKECFDRHWEFSFKDEVRAVDLPHDYSISQQQVHDTRFASSNAYFPGGTAVYRKKFHAPEEWRNQTVMLEFEGVYMNAVVRLNHNIIGVQPYGYSSFHCDLTPYLKPGKENLLSVHVNNDAMPNTRWYSGSGIYRHVWMLTAGMVHIAPYGIYVHTPTLDKAIVETTLANRFEQSMDITVRTLVRDREGQLVADNEIIVKLQPGENKAAQCLSVPNALPWSVDYPHLYTLHTELLCDGVTIDTTETVFGFRTITADAVNGFMLNGAPLKMKGGCVHHDCGLLGAAAFDRAEERKVELLKQSGFNAVRCAHNPPSPMFLDACDRLGMLVIDEAFDCWAEGKMDYDYHLYFNDWWQRDMTAMVMRDRNHPSVVLWSTGNEIKERDGRSDGYSIAQKLADFIRSLDNTRPVTNALCEVWGPDMKPDDEPDSTDFFALLTEKFAAPLDVVGYNYLRQRYEKDGQLYPGRIIVGTETFPKEAFEYWELVEKLPYVIGDFVWTSLDYLGEAGIGRVRYAGEESPHKKGNFPFNDPYPYDQAYCGDIDICGFKRPQSYYRDFVWGIGNEPYIAVYKPMRNGMEPEISAWGWPDVVNSWTWPGYESKPVSIDVYAGGDEVALFLNGVSLGRKPSGKETHYVTRFETEYCPGELVAIAYVKGVEQSRSVLRTAGEPAQIRLTADRTALKESSGDLSYVTVTLLDAEGNVAHQANHELYFTVSGKGTLQAVGNGNPRSGEGYTGPMRRAHEGRAMAVVKACGEKGTISLHVNAAGIPGAVLEINVGL